MMICTAGPPGTELDREKGKKISFSISNILSKEQQQQQQQRQHSDHTEQSDIEESDEEEGSDEESEPPDPEDVKQRLGGGLGGVGGVGGGLDPVGHLGGLAGLAGLPGGVSLSDPLKSYLSAAYSTSLAGVGHDILTGSSPLMGGGVAEQGNVIKVPAHRPPSLPLPLDYTAAPWLYRPPLSGLPSYLPLPSSLLLNRFGVGGEIPRPARLGPAIKFYLTFLHKIKLSFYFLVPFPARRIGHPYQNRTPPKRKKPRTSFSRLQICELEKRFHKQVRNFCLQPCCCNFISHIYLNK